jgi:Na+/proline symporter
MFVRVFYSGATNVTDVGNMKAIYDRTSACISYSTNYAGSYQTFISLDGLIFGVITTIGNFGAVFVDQSYWQLNGASSPKTASIAFIIAGLAYFFLPFCFGSSMSQAYLYLNSFNGGGGVTSNSTMTILSSSQIATGLVVPTVAILVYGYFGNYLVSLVVIFAVTTTVAGEILAVANILLNDIISVYITVCCLSFMIAFL